jgi:hypothetical protein
MAHRAIFMPQIGFAIVSHSNPAQTTRLMRCLGAVYGDPPITLHHDFEQCPAEFPELENLRIVRPSIRTRWGEFSFVEAILAAMRGLMDGNRAVDWFCLLSGSCYPIRAAETVIADLEGRGYDAYIHYERIDPWNARRRFHRECVRRYFGWRCRLPNGTYRDVPLPRVWSVFSPYARHGVDCYAGLHWFSCNRRAAEQIVSMSPAHVWLAEHLRHRKSPEENYFPTLWANHSGLRVSADPLRYVDWAGRGAHPKELGVEDFPAMIASGAHFARKFPAGGRVLDLLDEHLNVSVAH